VLLAHAFNIATGQDMGILLTFPVLCEKNGRMVVYVYRQMKCLDTPLSEVILYIKDSEALEFLRFRRLTQPNFGIFIAVGQDRNREREGSGPVLTR
jgi:hypothetical protein